MSQENQRAEPGLTVVHRGAIEAVDGVLERLRAEGIEAMSLDDPNWVIRLVAFGTYRVRVAVPDDQVQRAKEVLAAWDREVSGDLEGWSRELRVQLKLALLPTFVVCLWVMFRIPGISRLPWMASLGPLVFLASFVTIAWWQRRRRRR